MAYSGTPGTVTRDAVRLLVGDVSTSTSGEYLANADYDFFVAQTSNTYVAAQLAANSLAALFTGAASSAGASGFVEKKVGDLTLKKADATNLAKTYQQLSVKLQRMAASGMTPYAGGISASDKASVENETDRVRPRFEGGAFDNPSASDPARVTST
jgi:hypothetical protein